MSVRAIISWNWKISVEMQEASFETLVMQLSLSGIDMRTYLDPRGFFIEIYSDDLPQTVKQEIEKLGDVKYEKI